MRRALFLALLASCSQRDVLDPLPGSHVVLISIDTLRADHLGCYGYGRPTSPNLDAFARESLLFERVMSSSNNTAPSHMTMMSGVLPQVHGIDHGLPRRPSESLPLLAEILQREGYATWGMADGGYVSATFGFERGFQRFESRLSSLANKLPQLRQWIGPSPDQATFLFVHTYEAHAPYAPLPEHDLFSDPAYAGPLRERVAALREAFQKPELSLEMAVLAENFWGEDRGQIDERDCAHLVDLYDGDIHQADALVGALLDHLRSQGWFESSWIVIASDHGEAFREHGQLEHRNLYGEELSVPLLVRPPGGLPAGRRISALARVLDITPTILHAVGIPIPPTMQGSSLLPPGEAERPLSATAGEAKDMRALVLGQRKLIRHNPKWIELYDLAADPAEKVNLAKRETPPPWKAEIMEALDAIESDSRHKRASLGEPEALDALDEAQHQELQALGYVGETDDH